LALAYLRYLLSISSIFGISRYREGVGEGEGEGKEVGAGVGARSPRGRGRRKKRVGPTKGPKRYII
jgi:hypothetical protein